MHRKMCSKQRRNSVTPSLTLDDVSTISLLIKTQTKQKTKIHQQRNIKKPQQKKNLSIHFASIHTNYLERCGTFRKKRFCNLRVLHVIVLQIQQKQVSSEYGTFKSITGHGRHTLYDSIRKDIHSSILTSQEYSFGTWWK